MRIILHEAEPTRRFLEPIQAHDQALDFAALAEQLVDLLFGGVEGEVADVERCRVFELVFGRGGAPAEVVVTVAVSSALLGRWLVGEREVLVGGKQVPLLSRMSLACRGALSCCGLQAW